MPTSHNGWPVLTPSSTRLVPLAAITGRVRAGDVHTVLAELCRRYHAEVEPITRGHSWGHAYRPIRAGKQWSNHASGTAVDLNAPKHPMGTRAHDNFTPGQIAAIRRILADLPCIRWLDRHDPMHFEIRGGVRDVARVAATIRHPATKKEPNMALTAADITRILDTPIYPTWGQSGTVRAALAAALDLRDIRLTDGTEIRLDHAIAQLLQAQRTEGADQ